MYKKKNEFCYCMDEALGSIKSSEFTKKEGGQTQHDVSNIQNIKIIARLYSSPKGNRSCDLVFSKKLNTERGTGVHLDNSGGKVTTVGKGGVGICHL